MMARPCTALACLSLLIAAAGAGPEVGWPRAEVAERQPLLAQVARVRQALERLGAPMSPEAAARLDGAAAAGDDRAVTRSVEAALDPLCVAAVRVDGEGRATAVASDSPHRLVEQGWRPLLVKVLNPAGSTAALRVASPNAAPRPNSKAADVGARWLEVESFDDRPLNPTLGGLPLEYRVIQVYAAEAGTKRAIFRFNAGRRGGGSPAADEVRTWPFGRDVDGWAAAHDARIEAKDGVLRVDCLGIDPYLTAPVDADGGPMTVRIRARTDRDGVGQWFWATKEAPEHDARRAAYFDLTATKGRWRDYSVTFNVDGRLASVRLDPGDSPGPVEIESIQISRADRPSADWAQVDLAFEVDRSSEVRFDVKDEDGRPTTAAFRIEDEAGRVYPSQGKRLAPDFFFQAQVYRADGESIRLPPGTFTVVASRGPESVPEERTVRIADGVEPAPIAYRVRRWVDPSKLGWWSGDHHIHAAGCRHYSEPTEGVMPADMFRHCLGEDLKVGCCLTWGPCFDFQKQFFTGGVDKVSSSPYLLRYDIEVSGFGSHQSGHLCLLRLKDQMYPGGESTGHWPTLGLNTLRWAKAQGAITGPAHSANGLGGSAGRVDGPDGPDHLPDFTVPAYDGIGANEYVVDITHEVPGPDGKPVPAVDFISTMDTDRRQEWNMWYHTLNCGFSVRASGETDFPCISGDRVGMGRVYVKLDGPLDYADWCEGIRRGRSYVSDGSSHLMDFRLGGASLGDLAGKVLLPAPETLRASAKVAMRDPKVKTRKVELIVNGYPVASADLPADGTTRDVTFDVPIAKSSWVALRTFPTAHTNPIFVEVAGRPIRPSRRSVEWMLRGVDQCWSQKERFYKGPEKDQARAAYDHAREVYRKILAESDGD